MCFSWIRGTEESKKDTGPPRLCSSFTPNIFNISSQERTSTQDYSLRINFFFLTKNASSYFIVPTNWIMTTCPPKRAFIPVTETGSPPSTPFLSHPPLGGVDKWLEANCLDIMAHNVCAHLFFRIMLWLLDKNNGLAGVGVGHVLKAVVWFQQHQCTVLSALREAQPELLLNHHTGM